MKSYEKECPESISDAESYWVYSKLEWFQPEVLALGDTNQPFYKWLINGKMNVVQSVLGNHMERYRADYTALFWQNELGDTCSLSSKISCKNINICVDVLPHLGINKGDVVAVCILQIAKIVGFILLVAYLGAIWSIIFARFSSRALFIFCTLYSTGKPKSIPHIYGIYDLYFSFIHHLVFSSQEASRWWCSADHIGITSHRLRSNEIETLLTLHEYILGVVVIGLLEEDIKGSCVHCYVVLKYGTLPKNVNKEISNYITDNLRSLYCLQEAHCVDSVSGLIIVRLCVILRA